MYYSVSPLYYYEKLDASQMRIYVFATNDWSDISETCIYFSIVKELFELHSVVEPLTFSAASYHR